VHDCDTEALPYFLAHIGDHPVEAVWSEINIESGTIGHAFRIQEALDSGV